MKSRPKQCSDPFGIHPQYRRCLCIAGAGVAGLLVSLTGYSVFDAAIAGVIALWIIFTTLREVIASHEELIWPEKIVCGHPDHDEAVESK